MPNFGKSIELKILVVCKEILLLGYPQEAAGKSLQGKLTLNLSDSIKIKAIRLTFRGQSRIAFSDGSGSLCRKTEFAKTSQEFSGDETRTVRWWNAGRYSWAFEFQIPGDLPQSLEITQASIQYQLEAVVERPTFMINVSTKEQVRILRSVLPSEFEPFQSVALSRTERDVLTYQLQLPSRLYAFGETIQIRFTVLVLRPAVRCQSLTATLSEHGHCKTGDRRFPLRRLIRVGHADAPARFSAVWEGTLSVQVPYGPPRIEADVDHTWVDLCHKLNFALAWIDGDGQAHQLRSEGKVRIVPRYHDPVSQPVYTENILEELPWWNDADLEHVPSYTSDNSRSLPSLLPPDYAEQNASAE